MAHPCGVVPVLLEVLATPPVLRGGCPQPTVPRVVVVFRTHQDGSRLWQQHIKRKFQVYLVALLVNAHHQIGTRRVLFLFFAGLFEHFLSNHRF